jgi:TPP-dependent trihydroxycyclohexane-1,2-dione (THcHDO) dehydratase
VSAIRLTAAQALLRYLASQYREFDGVSLSPMGAM